MSGNTCFSDVFDVHASVQINKSRIEIDLMCITIFFRHLRGIKPCVDPVKPKHNWQPATWWLDAILICSII